MENIDELVDGIHSTFLRFRQLDIDIMEARLELLKLIKKTCYLQGKVSYTTGFEVIPEEKSLVMELVKPWEEDDE